VRLLTTPRRAARRKPDFCRASIAGNCALIGCARDDVGEESPHNATFVESARVFIDELVFTEYAQQQTIYGV
jgi:hypothetical protein